MGVEHALFCHKCKEWIDGHKNWPAYFAAGPGSNHFKDLEKTEIDRPPTWNECEHNKHNRDVWWYWSMRMFWFMWHHKDHGQEIIWLTDGSDEDNYYKFIKEYVEVFDPNKEEL